MFVDFDEGGNEYLVVDGFIDADTALAFENVAARENVETLVIAYSPGGFLDASHLIGRAIQKSRIDTVVLTECFSACIDIFLAGQKRFMASDSVLGLHASNVPELSYEDDLNYYRSLGFEELLKQSYEIPHKNIWLIEANQARQMGLATQVF